MPQTTAPRRIGRPRVPEVAERDERIYTLIESGIASRGALAKASGHDSDAVHLSCKRLQAQGRIRTCLGPKGAAVWSVDDGTPCP